MENFKIKLRQLKKQLKKNSYDHNLWFKLGCSYFSQLKFKRAIETLKKSINLKQDSKETWLVLGMTYYYSDMLDKSITAFTKALNIDPDFKIAETYLEYINFNKIKAMKQLSNVSIPDLNLLRLFIKDDNYIKNLLSQHINKQADSINADAKNHQGIFKTKLRFYSPSYGFGSY